MPISPNPRVVRRRPRPIRLGFDRFRWLIPAPKEVKKP